MSMPEKIWTNGQFAFDQKSARESDTLYLRADRAVPVDDRRALAQALGIVDAEGTRTDWFAEIVGAWVCGNLRTQLADAILSGPEAQS